MAAALSPDGRTIAIDLLGRAVDDRRLAARPRASSRQLRRAAAVVVARRPAPRVSGLSHQHLEHLDDRRRRHGHAAGDERAVRRSRAALVARRHAHRVLVRPQRQLRRLAADAEVRRGQAADHRPGQRLGAVVDGRRPKDRVRVRSTWAQHLRGRRRSAAREQPLVDDARGATARPPCRPDGKAVAFEAIAGAVSRLMIGASNIADAAEDVFPFRPQWISADEVLYTADGQIKRRPAAGGAARTIAFSADVTFTRPAFTPKRRAFDRTRRRIRCAASCILPSRPTARMSRSVRSAICGSRRPSEATSRRNASPVTSSSKPIRRGRRMAAAGILRPTATGRWTSGCATCGPASIASSRRGARGAPPGRPTARRSSFIDARRRTARRRRRDRQTREGARSLERAGPPQLVAGWPRPRDVGAAAVFDALPRRRQSGPARPRRRRGPDRWFTSAPAQVDRHARSLGPRLVAGWHADGGDRRRPPHDVSGRWRRHSAGPPRQVSSELANRRRGRPILATCCISRSPASAWST